MWIRIHSGPWIRRHKIKRKAEFKKQNFFDTIFPNESSSRDSFRLKNLKFFLLLKHV